jgi:DNA gyrase subunit A
LIFTTKGRVYSLKNYMIPDAGTVSKGKHIAGMINLQQDEGVQGFLTVRSLKEEDTDGKFIVMITRHGVIKRCRLAEFDSIRSSGIIALDLDEGDELIAALLSDGEGLVFLATREGMAIKFLENEVRPMGRPARGVKSMELSKDDVIIGAEIAKEEDLILSISEHGYGKRTPVNMYRLTHRGGKGVINMNTSKKVGDVVSVMRVKEDTDLMIITAEGKIIRIDAGAIRQVGRNSQGVRLVKMEEGDRVAAACVVPESDEPVGEDEPVQ